MLRKIIDLVNDDNFLSKDSIIILLKADKKKFDQNFPTNFDKI